MGVRGLIENGGGGDFARRLAAEVEAWLDEGLITTEQAKVILERYPQRGSGAPTNPLGGRVISVLAVMGAALIGLGIIAFIAANWSGMAPLSRVALMSVATPALHIVGWVLAYKLGHPRIGTAIILLGAIAYGAAIHLIAQAYHVPVNHPNLTAVWFLGVLPLAYITRSKPVVGMMLILLVAAVGFRSQEWFTEFHEGVLIFLTPPVYLVLAAALFGAGRLQRRYGHTMPLAFLFEAAGFALASVSLYVLSFNELWENVGQPSQVSFRAEYWIVIAGALIVAFATTLTGRLGDRGPERELLRWKLCFVLGATAALGAALAGLAFALEWMWWVFNLVMLAGVVGMIAAGYRWLRADLINFAVVIFAITLFTRYFEFGFGLLGQSLAFIVTGVLLLATGFGLECLRRRVVSRMRLQAGTP